jgi:hypothetical protein
MHIIGPTECGKSSLSVQMAVEWACAFQKAIIKACGALRVLVVQAEDDRQDSREMARVYHKLGLSAEQIELVKKNTRFVEWCPKGIERKGESAKEDFSESGAELTTFLEGEIKRGGPVDVVIVNPLSAYMDEGIMNQKANRGFFYGWITPFLRRQACAIVFVHHTPKFRDDRQGQNHHAQLYAGAGDATITNWPRASMFIRPTKEEGFFEFVTGKRGRRAGWSEQVRLFKWAEDCIFWQEASAQEKGDFYSSQKGGRAQSISAAELEGVMRVFKEEWILRGDLIHKLVAEGFSQASSSRAIHPDDGYLRANLLYQGKKKKLKIKWNGYSPSPL